MKAKSNNDQRIRTRIHIVSLVEAGHKPVLLSKTTGISFPTIYKWKRLYKAYGVKRLIVAPSSAKLTEEQRRVVAHILKTGAILYGFMDDRWLQSRIKKVLCVFFGVTYSTTQVRRIREKYSSYKPKLLFSRDKAQLSLLLSHLLKNTPRELGYDSERWTIPLAIKLGEKLFHKTYHSGQVSRYLNSRGWYFSRENLTANALKEILEILKTDDATKHGFSTPRWTVTRVIAFAKSGWSVQLHEDQVYTYLRQHGWYFNRQSVDRKGSVQKTAK